MAHDMSAKDFSNCHDILDDVIVMWGHSWNFIWTKLNFIFTINLMWFSNDDILQNGTKLIWLKLTWVTEITPKDNLNVIKSNREGRAQF